MSLRWSSVEDAANLMMASSGYDSEQEALLSQVEHAIGRASGCDRCHTKADL
jgi:hypothetical protein